MTTSSSDPGSTTPVALQTAQAQATQYAYQTGQYDVATFAYNDQISTEIQVLTSFNTYLSSLSPAAAGQVNYSAMGTSFQSSGDLNQALTTEVTGLQSLATALSNSGSLSSTQTSTLSQYQTQLTALATALSSGDTPSSADLANLDAMLEDFNTFANNLPSDQFASFWTTESNMLGNLASFAQSTANAVSQLQAQQQGLSTIATAGTALNNFFANIPSPTAGNLTQFFANIQILQNNSQYLSSADQSTLTNYLNSVQNYPVLVNGTAVKMGTLMSMYSALNSLNASPSPVAIPMSQSALMSYLKTNFSSLYTTLNGASSTALPTLLAMFTTSSSAGLTPLSTANFCNGLATNFLSPDPAGGTGTVTTTFTPATNTASSVSTAASTVSSVLSAVNNAVEQTEAGAAGTSSSNLAQLQALQTALQQFPASSTLSSPPTQAQVANFNNAITAINNAFSALPTSVSGNLGMPTGGVPSIPAGNVVSVTSGASTPPSAPSLSLQLTPGSTDVINLAQQAHNLQTVAGALTNLANATATTYTYGGQTYDTSTMSNPAVSSQVESITDLNYYANQYIQGNTTNLGGYTTTSLITNLQNEVSGLKNLASFLSTNLPSTTVAQQQQLAQVNNYISQLTSMTTALSSSSPNLSGLNLSQLDQMYVDLNTFANNLSPQNLTNYWSTESSFLSSFSGTLVNNATAADYFYAFFSVTPQPPLNSTFFQMYNQLTQNAATTSSSDSSQISAFLSTLNNMTVTSGGTTQSLQTFVTLNQSSINAGDFSFASSATLSGTAPAVLSTSQSSSNAIELIASMNSMLASPATINSTNGSTFAMLYNTLQEQSTLTPPTTDTPQLASYFASLGNMQITTSSGTESLSDFMTTNGSALLANTYTFDPNGETISGTAPALLLLQSPSSAQSDATAISQLANDLQTVSQALITGQLASSSPLGAQMVDILMNYMQGQNQILSNYTNSLQADNSLTQIVTQLMNDTAGFQDASVNYTFFQNSLSNPTTSTITLQSEVWFQLDGQSPRTHTYGSFTETSYPGSASAAQTILNNEKSQVQTDLTSIQQFVTDAKNAIQEIQPGGSLATKYNLSTSDTSSMISQLTGMINTLTGSGNVSAPTSTSPMGQLQALQQSLANIYIYPAVTPTAISGDGTIGVNGNSTTINLAWSEKMYSHDSGYRSRLLEISESVTWTPSTSSFIISTSPTDPLPAAGQVTYGGSNWNPAPFTSINPSPPSNSIVSNGAAQEQGISNGTTGLSSVATQLSNSSQQLSSQSQTAQMQLQMVMTQIQQEWTIASTLLQALNDAITNVAKSIYAG